MIASKFNWLTPKATLLTNKLGRKTVIARQEIFKLEVVAIFGGYPVSFQELTKLDAERVCRSVQIEEDFFLVSGESPDAGDHISHSCDPNCGIFGSIVVVAMKDISVREPITYDYAMTDTAPYDEFHCSCACSNCRKHVSCTDWKLPQLQAAYRGWFSAYIQCKINKS